MLFVEKFNIDMGDVLMEETISLKEIYQIIKKRIRMILILTVGAALISGIFTSLFITPIYQANSQILISQKQGQGESTVELNDIRLNVELINTYSDIIKSNRILAEVIDQLDLTMSTGALSNDITVRNANNSQVVTITVANPDPEVAVAIANTTVDVFQAQIGDLMNVDNINVLNPAQLPENPSPVSPNTLLNVAIAFVLGAMVGVGLAFLLEYLDTTIKTEQDIETTLGLPVLGVIPKITEEEINGSKTQPMTRTKRERGGYNGKTTKSS